MAEKRSKNNMRISRRDNGQMITMMGFIMILSVVVLASISSNLSNVGTEVSKVHSKALLPEFLTIRDKLGLATSYYANETSVEDAFDEACNVFYNISIKHGNYFSAKLNSCSYAGNTLYGAVFYVYATISLNDGTTQISKDVVYVVVQKTE